MKRRCPPSQTGHSETGANLQRGQDSRRLPAWGIQWVLTLQDLMFEPKPTPSWSEESAIEETFPAPPAGLEQQRNGWVCATSLSSLEDERERRVETLAAIDRKTLSVGRRYAQPTLSPQNFSCTLSQVGRSCGTLTGLFQGSALQNAHLLVHWSGARP